MSIFKENWFKGAVPLKSAYIVEKLFKRLLLENS